MDSELLPRVGVGVIIRNNSGEILLGLRKNSHGDGEWALPGGKVDFGETLIETVEREVKEETGLSVSNVQLISVCDDRKFISSHNKHFISIGFVCNSASETPTVNEPEKCSEWRWFPISKLPQNVFMASTATIENYQTGTIYRPQ